VELRTIKNKMICFTFGLQINTKKSRSRK